MKLSAAIMAHPKRADMVAELVTQLDRDVPVVWDEKNDRYDTGARALAAFDPDATHHLVIQDDVVPCRNLIAGVGKALEHVPADVPVSLYVGRVRPFAAAVTYAVEQAGDRASFITMNGIYWGPAVAVPTSLLPDMLEWFTRSRVANYDGRMSAWFSRRKIDCWYTWPSLVEHRGDESLAHAKSRGGRRTYRFLGENSSALSVDWTGPVVKVPNTAKLDRERQRLANRAQRQVSNGR